MLQRGPVIETVRGTRVHWLGVLEPDVLDPTLRHRIEHELEARAFALLTAAGANWRKRSLTVCTVRAV